MKILRGIIKIFMAGFFATITGILIYYDEHQVISSFQASMLVLVWYLVIDAWGREEK